MSSKLKVVLLTIDKAGEIMIQRLVGCLTDEIELSLVVTRETRDYDFDGNPVINACRIFGLKYIQPDFSKNNYLAKISSLKPDVIIISNFHKIIKKELIDIPIIGTYNLHSSMLPKMRGGTSLIWALKNGMVETGVTLHCVTEGIDDGDIISQMKVPISQWDTQGSLYEKITIAKFEILLNFLNKLKNREYIHRYPQDHSEATYLPKRKDDDGLLDISGSMESLYNHLRSFDPWTGAYFPIENKKIRLRSTIPSMHYIESRVNENELILGKESSSRFKALIIRSVTDVVERPGIFDKNLATKVLEYWKAHETN